MDHDEIESLAILSIAEKNNAWILAAVSMLILGGLLNLERIVDTLEGSARVEALVPQTTSLAEFVDHRDEPQTTSLAEPALQHEAFESARGVGVARVLGTYGGPGEGTVYDIIRNTEYNLGELFAQGMARSEPEPGPEPRVGFNPSVVTREDPKSTFSIDVDTASYSNARRSLLEHQQLPAATVVRTEELINYFDYDYPPPTAESEAPFSLTTEVGPCPWAPERRLVHLGIRGFDPVAEALPPRNLVYLIDVSGSMNADDRLPLIKHGLAVLSASLGPQDRVSIVVYAGASGLVLPPTPGTDRAAILGALDRLEAGGSTNGGAGIELAYALAERNFLEGGINRVILATDGDFNVGVTDHDQLVALIERKRETGVFLSILGVGDHFNDHLMEQLADKGNGNYAYLDGMREARKVLVQDAGGTLVTIAKDVKIQVEFDPTQVVTHRLIGYENRVLAHRDFADDQKDAGEIGAGHTVTALYEVELIAAAKERPLATLALRFKLPDGQRSSEVSTTIGDRGSTMASTSADFRFAAAVAAFGLRLRGAESPSHAEILALAAGALGADPLCYRHEFLELVWQAATLSGETLARPDSACTETTLGGVPELAAARAVREVRASDEIDWRPFVLEVLRLLPIFLALPLFVMAHRRRRPPRT